MFLFLSRAWNRLYPNQKSSCLRTVACNSYAWRSVNDANSTSRRIGVLFSFFRRTRTNERFGRIRTLRVGFYLSYYGVIGSQLKKRGRLAMGWKVFWWFFFLIIRISHSSHLYVCRLGALFACLQSFAGDNENESTMLNVNITCTCFI
jgi:hypothetical protein